MARALLHISADLRQTAERARDWWGEAPDLALSASKAAEVREYVVGRAKKPPSRGPACGIKQRMDKGRSNASSVQFKAPDDGDTVGRGSTALRPKH